MVSTAVRQFKAMFPSSATPSKLSPAKFPVPLQLFNIWGTDTLDDLTDLIGLFGVHVHLTGGKQGCIAVLWLCSASDVNRLTKAIEFGNTNQQESVFVEHKLASELNNSKKPVAKPANSLKHSTVLQQPVRDHTMLELHQSGKILLCIVIRQTSMPTVVTGLVLFSAIVISC